MAQQVNNRMQFIFTATSVAILTHFLGMIPLGLAAVNGSPQQQAESASSTQPLWSYQIKPTNYLGAQSAPGGSYTSGSSSIFDAFTSLSQRQGALSANPFLSILPIILIAAGGFLLLLPMLTMMIASPFGGAGPFGGGYQNYGYPQVGALNKRRSSDSPFGASSRSIIELIENVSATIEDLTRKYASNTIQQQTVSSADSSSQPSLKRSKALYINGSQNNQHYNHQQPQQQQSAGLSPNELSQAKPANHKPAQPDGEMTNSANNINSVSTGA